TLSEAIGQSIAPDGGLYVPAIFPTFNAEDFAGVNAWNEIGKRLLEPFFRDDNLHAHLSDICDEAFNFPITLRFRNNDTAVLELFHGPTAAFKDVGARFLAACVARMPGRRTIIVATSGDTGGAVAAAFAERSDVEVVILFPKEKISARQQQQLTCWATTCAPLPCVVFSMIVSASSRLHSQIENGPRDAVCCRPTASTLAGCCRRLFTTQRRVSGTFDSVTRSRDISSPPAISATRWRPSGPKK